MEQINKRFFQCSVSGVMMGFDEFRDEMHIQKENWEQVVSVGHYVEMRLATPEEIESGEVEIYSCWNPEKFGACWVKVN